MIRLGIDVGGTNTDGVILSADNEILASTKSTTTKDIFSGIKQTLNKLMEESKLDAEKIEVATLGTTHCTNAIVERKGLNRVGIIRICLPSGSAVTPLLDWPQDLVDQLDPVMFLIHGGYEYNGEPIAALEENELQNVVEKLKEEVDSIAITSVFSPVQNKQEKYVAEYLSKAMPEIPISISSEIGSVGLIERENATILNAALMSTIRHVSEGFQQALGQEGIQAKIFLGQNDGTLMTNEYAQKYPIYTIACGPTNSIRGAAHLTNEPNAIVVDIGGTTTDIGVLANSFPRQTSLAVEVGGVRTNYRMPDIYSVGFGGGTRIHQKDEGWKVGPDSVGYRLMEEAKSFGGETLTATDIAIAKGQVRFGEANIDSFKDLPIEDIYEIMTHVVEEAIDRMKTNSEDATVVLVGGGAALMPEALKGASKVIRPAHAGVANAIGAALGDISGTVERIYLLENESYETIMENAKAEAVKNAVAAGADPDQIQIIQLEDFPLAYLPGQALLVKVKVAGPLKI